MRYQIVMSNSAGILDESLKVPTLKRAKKLLVNMALDINNLDAGDTFTVVDHAPDKEPVYE